MLDLEVVKDFGLVAAHGSFSAAARESGRPKSTLSRHVIALERQLSLELFDRSTPSLRLTPAGERLLERTSRIVEQMYTLENELDDFSRTAGAPPS